MHIEEYEEAHRLIFLPVDIEDVALLDSPGMGVHEERFPVDHILYESTDITKSPNAHALAMAPQQASAEQCTRWGYSHHQH